MPGLFNSVGLFIQGRQKAALHKAYLKYVCLNTFMGRIPQKIHKKYTIENYNYLILNHKRWLLLGERRKLKWDIPYDLSQGKTAYHLYMEAQRREIIRMERAAVKHAFHGGQSPENDDPEHLNLNYALAMIEISKTYLENDSDVEAYWKALNMDSDHSGFWLLTYLYSNNERFTRVKDPRIKRLMVARCAQDTAIKMKLDAIEDQLCQHKWTITHQKMIPRTTITANNIQVRRVWAGLDLPYWERYLRQFTDMFIFNEPFIEVTSINIKRHILAKAVECMDMDEHIKKEWAMYAAQNKLDVIEEEVCSTASQFDELLPAPTNQKKGSSTPKAANATATRKYRPFRNITRIQYKREILWKKHQIESVNAILNAIMANIQPQNLIGTDNPANWIWKSDTAQAYFMPKERD
jgi:hypothetical protein